MAEEKCSQGLQVYHLYPKCCLKCARNNSVRIIQTHLHVEHQVDPANKTVIWSKNGTAFDSYWFTFALEKNTDFSREWELRTIKRLLSEGEIPIFLKPTTDKEAIMDLYDKIFTLRCKYPHSVENSVTKPKSATECVIL